jgi:hypothetical protein
VRRLGLLAVAVFAIALLTAATSSGGQRLKPTLTLHPGSSIVVDGAHFRQHERVKVTSSTGTSATVRANSRGNFTVTLHGMPVDRCSALVVRAQGSAGSFAMARRPPLPECAPMRTQGSAA